MHKITIDVVICELSDSFEKFKLKDDEEELSKFAYTNYKRAQDIKNTNRGTDVYKSLKRAYPEINWRLKVTQSKHAAGFSELDFNPKNTGKL